MAEVTPTDANWVQVLLGLPRELQGIVVLGVGLALGWLVWRRFHKSFTNPEEPHTELIVKGTTKVQNMQPIRDLTEQMGKYVESNGHLAMLLMKNEVATSSLVSGLRDYVIAQNDGVLQLSRDLSQLASLFENHLLELRQEREEAEDRRELEAARQEGYAKAMADMKTAPKTNRKTATSRTTASRPRNG